MTEHEVVWLDEERTYAYLLSEGAYFSTVRFERDGIEYTILVEREDYTVLEGHYFDDDA